MPQDFMEDHVVPIDQTPFPNRATRRAAGRRARKLGALGSGAVLASGVAAAAIGLSAAPAGAATFTVTSATDDGTGDPGTLSEAINDANVDTVQDTIDFNVPGGVITLSGDLPTITEAVDIVGPGRDALTLDAAGNAALDFDEIDEATVMHISGITITNADKAGDGAAVNIEGSDADVALAAVALTNNTASSQGGAVHCSSDPGGVAVSDSIITGNHSDSGGGGMYLDCNGDHLITNTLFQLNTSDSRGGALYSDDGAGTLTISNSTFVENHASNDCGAVYINRGLDVTISNSTFADNTTDEDGGAVCIEPDESTVTTRIIQSTFTGNAAGGSGGAIAAVDGSVELIQSTISGNTAGESGGGVYLYGVSPNDVSVKETSDGPVGALELESATSTGTIISGNTATGTPAANDVGADGPITLVSDHSLFGAVDPIVTVSDVGGTQNGVTDPGLSALADNGGPTKTMALTATSPALNAGPVPVPSFAGNEFDQRGPGYPRVSSGRVDVGAYEFQALEIVPRFTG
jgi:predicted outer membrane repeat protein